METTKGATPARAPRQEERPLGFENAIALFNDRVRRSRPATVLRWKEGGLWREATWNEWDEASRQIAAGLRGLSVGRGERCCILANTRAEWLYADIGILLAGAIAVPIYPSNLADECRFIANDAGAKVVFVEDLQQLQKLLSVRSQLGSVTKVVYFDASAPRSDDAGRAPRTLDEVLPPSERDWVLSLAELRDQGRRWLADHDGELERGWEQIGLDDPFTFVYTSGTTGAPKGVVLTHRNIVWECEAVRDVIVIDEHDEQLLFLPMAHIFARLLEWVTIGKGSRIAFAESVAKIKENLAETRPTFMCVVPRVLEKVYLGILGNRDASPPVKQKIFDWAFGVGRQVSAYKQRQEPVPLGLSLQNAVATRLVFAKIQAVLGGRIRFLISGGAPLSKEIAEFFHAAGVLVLEGWGLTETFAGTCVNRPEKFAFGTVGPAAPGVELQIAEDGEILVRGGSVMQGYYNQPEATRDAIDAEGWFHTGDVGVLEGGFLRITDRKKDLIVNAGGKNIAPQPLENALKATPYVSQVMVHGDKRPYLVALITLNEENLTRWAREQGLSFGSLAELTKLEPVRRLVQSYIDTINAKQPGYSSIRRFALLPHDFSQETGELTPTLKVKRKFTSEKYRQILDNLYNN